MKRNHYFIASILLVFSILGLFQNCSKYPYQDTSTAASQSLDKKIYYAVQPNYVCTNAAGQTGASYKNSIYILNGEMCETGDLCHNKVSCQAWPQSLVVANDLQSLQYNGVTYQYMATPPY